MIALLAAGLSLAVATAEPQPSAKSAEDYVYADDRIPTGEPAWQTPVDLALGIDGSIFIAGRDSGRILRLRSGNAKPETWAQLDRLLWNITIDPIAKRLYASIGHAEGEVVAFDLITANQLWRKKIGHTPRQIIANGNTLYVACQHENDVAALSAATGDVIKRYAVEREPVALALAGDRLVVINQIPNETSNKAGVSAGVNIINLRSGQTSLVKLPPGAHSAQGVAISADGRRAYVPSIISSYHLPTSQIERGWIQMAGLSVIDIEAGKLADWFILDDVDLGAANPWDCVILKNKLVISLSGTHELMIIDLDGLSKIEHKDGGKLRQLGEIASVRQRVALPGDKGPRALLPSVSGVWYASAFSDSLGFVAVADGKIVRQYPFATNVKPTAARLGEAYFHDATLSAQHWLSCSSCHPGNARVDGLNWDLLNDGIGTYKNTKNLVGAHDTAPTTWTGVRANANVSVRAGMKHILFHAADEPIAEALDAYLSGLRYLPSPHLAKGDKTLIETGRKLFTEKGCTDCHDGAQLTNQRAYNLGTGTGSETDIKFDVPTLREIWRTGPYLHDGRAATIEEAIRELQKNERFRSKTAMNDDELKAVVAYLQTL